MDMNRKRRHADYMFAKRNVEKSNQTYNLHSHVIPQETNHDNIENSDDDIQNSDYSDDLGSLNFNSSEQETIYTSSDSSLDNINSFKEYFIDTVLKCSMNHNQINCILKFFKRNHIHNLPCSAITLLSTPRNQRNIKNALLSH